MQAFSEEFHSVIREWYSSTNKKKLNEEIYFRSNYQRRHKKGSRLTTITALINEFISVAGMHKSVNELKLFL